MSINKRTFTLLGIFLIAGIMIYSPFGWNIRQSLAERIVVTRFQPYAWIFVGKSQMEQMQREKIIAFCGYLPDATHPCK